MKMNEIYSNRVGFCFFETLLLLFSINELIVIDLGRPLHKNNLKKAQSQ